MRGHCNVFVRVCAALLMLSACLPVRSKVPVGSTVGFKADTDLLGTWKTGPSVKGEPATVHIVRNRDGSMTAILLTKDDEWSEYRLHVAQLGANRFMSAQEVSNSGEVAGGPLADDHIVLLYRISGGERLTLLEMNETAAAAAVRAGKITGEIEPGENGDVRLTALGPELDTFMARAPAATLFRKELATFQRAK